MKLIKIIEQIQNSKKMCFEELLNHYNLSFDDYSDINDIWIQWHNKNQSSAINKLLKNTKNALISKILFYQQQILKIENFGSDVLTVKEFENALNKTITIYRGGSGKYDSKYSNYNRKWVSFTASKERMDTFSVYDGSIGQNVYMLPKNKKYWQVKVNCKLDDILLYYDVGDDEVIVPLNIAKTAKIIMTK